jgi:hypothetical protein
MNERLPGYKSSQKSTRDENKKVAQPLHELTMKNYIIEGSREANKENGCKKK